MQTIKEPSCTVEIPSEIKKKRRESSENSIPSFAKIHVHVSLN